MDLVTLGGAALRLTPPGKERLRSARTLTVGVTGPECNASIAAGRLGVDATWLSRLPEGPLGRRVANDLRSHDIEVVASFEPGRLGLTFFERGASPREHDRVDDLAGAVFEGLTMDDLPQERIETAEYVYVTAATPQASTGLAGATAKFLKTASDGGATTAFGLLDTRGWEDNESARDTFEGLFSAVDVLVADDDAVDAVFDRSGEPGSVMHALASSYDFETVALRHDHGAAAWHESTVHEFGYPEIETVDVTGAADAFAGVFLSGLDRGDVSAALRTAIAADAYVQTTPGSLPVFTIEEIERVVAKVERG